MLKKFLDKILGRETSESDETKTETIEDVKKRRRILPGDIKLGKKKDDLYRSDVALKPKEKKPYYYWGKKPDHLKDGEARRIFSTSMMTRNRELRTTGPNLESLAHWGLPVLRTERDVASLLEIDRKSLWFFANHRFDDRIYHYVQFAVPKRTGGERIIMAPKRGLKHLQRGVKREIVDKLRVHDAAHGFVKNRSTATHAALHVGNPIVVKFDLKDFFPSVTFARVRGKFVKAGYDFVIATSLALLCTEAERQPVELTDGTIRYAPIGHRYCVQGAPTSPGLCNAIAHKMDVRLSGFAKKYGWTYSRYADDMTFSGGKDTNINQLLGTVRDIVETEGFELNHKKTRVMRQSNSQRVTGIVVNDVLSVPRTARRKIRSAIHTMKTTGDDSRRSEIEGYIAYVKMVNRAQGDALESYLNA